MLLARCGFLQDTAFFALAGWPPYTRNSFEPGDRYIPKGLGSCSRHNMHQKTKTTQYIDVHSAVPPVAF